ncbi:MAG: sarcosine oxidase subunit alpha family protein [Acidiferrobacterales bacterium]
MSQAFRIAHGGIIDRNQPIEFIYDGRTYEGYAGDTLASALLANGARVCGRSFKYHRPRGVYTAGVEEPSALVQLRAGERTEPNTRATQVELFAGLRASSQNCFPTVNFDLGSIAGWFWRLLPAGFYYKTFMWPGKWWMTYEHFIRKAAGMGQAPREPDPDEYERRYAHCDVLVVGSGPAGLAATLAAARAGARVILAEERTRIGGSLCFEQASINDAPALDWVRAVYEELANVPDVHVLSRTTVFGYYDHNLLALVERVGDHLHVPPARQPRQRLWWVRAKQVVLATGAIERPFVFANNDLPGIMLASAARAYVNQYAVRPGKRAVVFTGNDSAYATARDLATAGVEIAAVVDVREHGPGATALKGITTEVLCGHAVAAAEGAPLRAVRVGKLNVAGDGYTDGLRRIECDLLCVSGGWTPTVHLFSQSRGQLAWREDVAAFVPGASFQAEHSAGACRGSFTLRACLEEGLHAGSQAAAVAGGQPETIDVPVCAEEQPAPMQAPWSLPLPGKHGTRFVDIQNDVTLDDVSLAVREGYANVEHLKRYTTLGMGTDQGRTSNLNGLAILAAMTGAEVASLGTTTFRPPYTPLTMGALAARETGAHFEPVRRSAMHEWHLDAGAHMITAGLWLRPQCYRRNGESLGDAVRREAKAVRTKVGIVDVSTLGKIDIQGDDAALFLERVYVNRWQRLSVGRCRYGVMLREDGMVMDDGTVTRIAEKRYYMTTTTANAGNVMSHLEHCAQVLWPDLDVRFAAVSEQWSGMAIAGPRSRELLERVAQLELSDATLPFLGYKKADVAGAPARIFRITYSGERAYEVHVPADFGLSVWQAFIAAGESFGVTPYGTESMSILRIEKGHVVVGAEIDGRTTADDLGLGRLVKTAGDFIGKRSLERPELRRDDRKQLVGIIPTDGQTMIPRGAQLVADPNHILPNPMLGHVTSTCYSPNLEQPIALVLLSRGRTRHGERIFAMSPLEGATVEVAVTSPVFFDPEGTRAHG